MLVIPDIAYVSLVIDSVEISGSPNAINTIFLSEGNGAAVPALKIILNDPLSQFNSEKTFSDGNLIELNIAKSPTDAQASPRKYRIYSTHYSNAYTGPLVTIVGILDAPKYIAAAKREAFKGNSSEALAAVANDSGLTYDGPQNFNGKVPKDQQTWLNVCKNRAMFVLETSRRGWIDEHSCMAAIVTSYGVLRYRNLSDVINEKADKIKYAFLYNCVASSEEKQKKVYNVRETMDRSSSGFAAHWQNYGSKRVINKLDGTPDKVDQLQVITPGSYLSLNSEVKKDVQKARFDYAPIDCGNTHDKFEHAVYQNIKLLALFSEKISVLVDVVTDVQLFDPVIYRQADINEQKQIKTSDIYIVIGKVVQLSGGVFYHERLELARMSLTMKGSANLASPANTASEKSMIPDVQVDRNSAPAPVSLPTAQKLDGMTKEVQQQNFGLDVVRTAAVPAMTDVQSGVSQVKSAVDSGDDTLIKSSVSSLRTQVQSANSQLTSLRTIASTTAGQVSNIVDATYGQAKSVASQVISTTDGVLDTIAKEIDTVRAFAKMENLLQMTLNYIPLAKQGFQDVQDLKSTVSGTTSGVTDTYNGITSKWNQVAGLVNKRRPGSIPTAKGTDVAYRLNSAMDKGTKLPKMNPKITSEITKQTTVPNYVNAGVWKAKEQVTEIKTLDAAITDFGQQINRIKP